MTAAPIEAQHAATRDLCLLVSRLLAAEVDGALLARLRDAPGLLDPAVARLDDDAAVEELAVEYCRLFIGPDPVCVPYASAHTGGRRLGGRAEQEFVAFLDRAGLGPRADPSLRLLGVDHLGVAMAVLAHLHDRLAADPRCAQTRRTFDELVCGHLAPWAADWGLRLAGAARWAPYTVVGAAVHGSLIATGSG